MDRIQALRLFADLSELRSFSAAAKRSKVKQSTASKWIAALEAELGTTLVQRTTRSVQLSEGGHRLLVHARDVLASFDRMSTDFVAQNPVTSGRVRVSAPVVFGRLFIVPLVAEFLAAHALVSAELVLGDRYVNLVEDGFDLAVRVGVATDTSARGRKLADSRRELVASPSYLASRTRPSVPADLRAHECLVHGDASTTSIWRFGQKKGNAIPVHVRGRFSANNSEAVLVMARRGLGIALLADWLVGDDLRKGRLVPLLEDFASPAAPVHALHSGGRFPSPAVRALMDHLEKHLGARLATGSTRAPGR